MRSTAAYADRITPYRRRSMLIIQVTAGVISGVVIKDCTRTWTLSPDEVGDPDVITTALGSAQAWASYLMDPRNVNWVHLDWVWT